MQILSSVMTPVKWILKSRGRLIVTVIILACLGFWGYKTFSTSKTQVQLQTAQADKGTLVTSVTASGAVSSGNSASITTQATGVVSNVYAKDGDMVTRGQKIADITLDLSGQQKQAAAYASYISASNSLVNAQNSLRGSEATLAKVLDDIHLAHGTTEAAQKDETLTERQTRTTAEVAKDNAFNGVKTTQAQISSAALALQQTSATIIAPTTGTISGLTLIPGAVIAGNSSSSTSTTTPTSYGTVKLANNSLQATVNLTEIDVTKVQNGQKATMTMDAFPDKTFTGKVTAIDTNGAVSSGVTTYPATITFDTGPNNIYPNMAVSATIITDVKNNAILVPSGAIQTTNGVSTVQVQKNRQTQTIDVTIGDSNDTQTEILSGVNEGDVIVTGTSNTGAATTGTSPFGNTRGGFGGGGVRGVQFIGR